MAPRILSVLAALLVALSAPGASASSIVNNTNVAALTVIIDQANSNFIATTSLNDTTTIEALEDLLTATNKLHANILLLLAHSNVNASTSDSTAVGLFEYADQGEMISVDIKYNDFAAKQLQYREAFMKGMEVLLGLPADTVEITDFQPTLMDGPIADRTTRVCPDFVIVRFSSLCSHTHALSDYFQHHPAVEQLGLVFRTHHWQFPKDCGPLHPAVELRDCLFRLSCQA